MQAVEEENVAILDLQDEFQKIEGIDATKEKTQNQSANLNEYRKQTKKA